MRRVTLTLMRWRLLPLLLVLAGCGGDKFSTGDGATGSGGNPATSGSAGGGVARDVECPMSEPTAGTACTALELDCSYGDDPRPSCRSRFSCRAMVWDLVQDGSCAADATCPSSPPPTGSDCLSLNQQCAYPSQQTFCTCPPCQGFCPSEVWVCSIPPSAACAAALPNAGTACTGSATCTYGSCRLGDATEATCQGGVWDWSPLACAE